MAIVGEGIPVIASRVGAFGLVLQALGVNAFDSGLAQAEATNLAQLNRPVTERERERRREGKGGGPDKRIYLEALKTTMKGKHAAAILKRPGLRSRFVCSHGCCQFRGFEDLPARRRQHFLWSRDAEVSAIKERPTGGLRRDYVRELLALVVAGRRSEARALAGFIPAASSSFDACSPTSGCHAGGSANQQGRLRHSTWTQLRRCFVNSRAATASQGNERGRKQPFSDFR